MLMEQGAADTEQLRNLIPNSEQSVTKETEAENKNANDSRFSTTFGFSHGVNNDNGGILVRKMPTYKGGL